MPTMKDACYLACDRVGLIDVQDFGSTLGDIPRAWYMSCRMSHHSYADCQLQEVSCLSYTVAGTNVPPSFSRTPVVGVGPHC